MPRFFVQYLAINSNTNCTLAKIVAKVGSEFYQILNNPLSECQILKISPTWQSFAKSGHTVWHLESVYFPYFESDQIMEHWSSTTLQQLVMKYFNCYILSAVSICTDPYFKVIWLQVLLQRSEFGSRWNLQFFPVKFVFEKIENKEKEARVGPFLNLKFYNSTLLKFSNLMQRHKNWKNKFLWRNENK